MARWARLSFQNRALKRLFLLFLSLNSELQWLCTGKTGYQGSLSQAVPKINIFSSFSFAYSWTSPGPRSVPTVHSTLHLDTLTLPLTTFSCSFFFYISNLIFLLSEYSSDKDTASISNWFWTPREPAPVPHFCCLHHLLLNWLSWPLHNHMQILLFQNDRILDLALDMTNPCYLNKLCISKDC